MWFAKFSHNPSGCSFTPSMMRWLTRQPANMWQGTDSFSFVSIIPSCTIKIAHSDFPKTSPTFLRLHNISCVRRNNSTCLHFFQQHRCVTSYLQFTIHKQRNNSQQARATRQSGFNKFHFLLLDRLKRVFHLNFPIVFGSVVATSL